MNAWPAPTQLMQRAPSPHHGARNAQNGGHGDGTEVAAVERRRIRVAEQEQLALARGGIAPGLQWPMRAVVQSCRCTHYAVDAHGLFPNTHRLRRDGADTFEDRHALGR
jgi:hypothetical protein